MTALWIIGGVGFGVLLLSFLFDGLFDSLDLDLDGVPFVTTFSAFAGAFGLSGATLIHSGVGAFVALLVGVVIAIVTAAVIFWTYRALKKNAEKNRDADVAELVGQMATVTTWGTGTGEVLATWAGSTRKVRALCPEPVTVGQEVEIIELVGNNVVKVRTYK